MEENITQPKAVQDQAVSNQAVQQPSAQEPKKKSVRKFLLIILGIIILLGVGGGSYYLGANKNSGSSEEKQIENTVVQTIIPPKTVSPTSAQATIDSSKKLSFQDSISAYCKKEVLNSSSSRFVMDLSALPLKIDNRFVIPMPAGDNIPQCWNMPGKDWFFFQSSIGDGFDVFDDNSVELGHGGYPILKPAGTKFYDNNGETLYFIRGVGIGSYIGTEGIDIKGFKKLTWSSGESIYITTGKRAISPDDSRLLSVLNKYAIEGKDDTTKGHMVVDSSKELQADEDIKNTFFKDVNTLQSPEKEAVNSLLNNLNAFSIE